MKLELVSFLSTDKLELPGLLYQPEKPSRKVLLWLHGNGDSGVFYNQTQMNALGNALTQQNVAFFAFNNRGAHRTKKLHIADKSLTLADQYVLGGSYYEKIADCVKDIDGAVAFLKSKDYSEFYLAGSSTGANKICAYHLRTKHNPFSKYILASAGDDSGIYYSELGSDRFNEALKYAREEIAAGNPLFVMPEYTGMHPFSAQSAADILDPDGPYNTFPYYEQTQKRLGTKPLFEEYKQLNLPLLVIYGQDDEYTFTAGGTDKAIAILKGQTSPEVIKDSSFEVILDADHGFHGQEIPFAQKVASWLK